MRSRYKVLISLLLALFFFAAGSIYQWLNLWSQFPVEVTFTNESGKQITHLRLTFDSHIKGSLNLPTLAPGESIKAKYYPSGEGGFMIEATLADGQVLKHTEGYVEAGYSFDEVIASNGINHKL